MVRTQQPYERVTETTIVCQPFSQVAHGLIDGL